MNTNENLGYLLQHVSAVLARQSDQVLQEQLGIGFSQFKILMLLGQEDSTQQREMAVALGQTEASISRQVKLLHENGLIVSQVSPRNRRQNITRLTAKGLRLTEKATEILNRYHSPIFNELSERQQYVLTDLLATMHHAVCADPNH